jgi:cyanophycinase-like exopeptidase
MTQPLNIQLATPVTLLVLIGGGEFSFGETREIDEFLVRNMPPDRRTIAFLPTASESAEYAVHLGKYFKQIDPALETINVPIYRGRDSRRQKNLNYLLSAGMIYVGGGVTNNLLATLRESPAEIAMRDAAAKGAVVAAIGAGAACFGVHARDMRTPASALPALGWLEQTVIDTGFDPQDDTMLRRLMSLPDVKIGIGIPPRTAVAIQRDGTSSVLGSGNIAVFRKS